MKLLLKLKKNLIKNLGTPGYMAPEVLWRQNHGFAVDFYAIGVILFELMMHRRPYKVIQKI